MREVLIAVLLASAFSTANAGSDQSPEVNRPAVHPQGFTLTTTAFEDGGIIPDKYTANASVNPVSPALQWSHVPAGTISFALVMHDPDNSLNGGSEDILHWLIFNIPGTANQLPEGVPPIAQLPDGSVQVVNLKHKYAYLSPGAWAPSPYHHHTFEILALDTQLKLGSETPRGDFLRAIEGHILSKAVLVGRFHR
jgi:Raf kinase inhibitor-like YbhB/YbcL family protein